MTVAPSIDPARLLEEQLAQASPERTNRRNGYRGREFDTRAGTLDLLVPKLREKTYFPEWLLERRKRAERALTSVVATCYLLGVSTRRMDRLVQSLGITTLSKSQVSEMAKDLDAHVEQFRTRRLEDAGPFTFLAADALVLKVREGGRVVPVHALVATGVSADGHREILGVQVTTSEDGAGWLGFFRDLTARGLSGVKLVTSDAHAGLTAAIAATLPGAAWQRCRTHYAANLMSLTPKSSWGWVKALLHSIYDQPDAEAVHAPVRPRRRRAGREASRGRRAPRGSPPRHPRLHRLPQGDLAPDLVQQPQRTSQPRDPTPHRRRRHLPRPSSHHPTRRRRPGRAARRVGRRPPLPRPRRPSPLPGHHPPPRRGGDRGIDHAGHHGLNHNDEGSNVVHHLSGLDRDRLRVAMKVLLTAAIASRCSADDGTELVASAECRSVGWVSDGGQGERN